ncbi:MAG: hypothetical protein J5888_04290 [Bacteroidaceae bacterium]|nr:hypothetical protein [Bacteroidaceae bacterium]
MELVKQPVVYATERSYALNVWVANCAQFARELLCAPLAKVTDIARRARIVMASAQNVKARDTNG